jgi:hypothetical protein
MRFFGLCSALVCLVMALSITGCLGGDDTSVAPPPAADAGPDATTKADSGSEPADSGSSEPVDDAGDSGTNPFG